jgi:hypothetical protein
MAAVPYYAYIQTRTDMPYRRFGLRSHLPTMFDAVTVFPSKEMAESHDEKLKIEIPPALKDYIDNLPPKMKPLGQEVLKEEMERQESLFRSQVEEVTAADLRQAKEYGSGQLFVVKEVNEKGLKGTVTTIDSFLSMNNLDLMTHCDGMERVTIPRK